MAFVAILYKKKKKQQHFFNLCFFYSLQTYLESNKPCSMKEISNTHLPEQNELKILENQVNTIDLIKDIISDPVSEPTF